MEPSLSPTARVVVTASSVHNPATGDPGKQATLGAAAQVFHVFYYFDMENQWKIDGSVPLRWNMMASSLNMRYLTLVWGLLFGEIPMKFRTRKELTLDTRCWRNHPKDARISSCWSWKDDPWNIVEWMLLPTEHHKTIWIQAQYFLPYIIPLVYRNYETPRILWFRGCVSHRRIVPEAICRAWATKLEWWMDPPLMQGKPTKVGTETVDWANDENCSLEKWNCWTTIDCDFAATHVHNIVISVQIEAININPLNPLSHRWTCCHNNLLKLQMSQLATSILEQKCCLLWDIVIELDDGKICRKAIYLMVKTMVSCEKSPLNQSSDIVISGHLYIADSKLCNVLFTLELARRLRPVREDPLSHFGRKMLGVGPGFGLLFNGTHTEKSYSETMAYLLIVFQGSGYLDTSEIGDGILWSFSSFQFVRAAGLLCQPPVTSHNSSPGRRRARPSLRTVLAQVWILTAEQILRTKSADDFWLGRLLSCSPLAGLIPSKTFFRYQNQVGCVAVVADIQLTLHCFQQVRISPSM